MTAGLPPGRRRYNTGTAGSCEGLINKSAKLPARIVHTALQCLTVLSTSLYTQGLG